MDDPQSGALSRADAERLNYTVPFFKEGLRRLTSSERTWRQKLAQTPEDGPDLPMVLVAGGGRGRGRSEHRVRPQDLEEYIALVSTPAPLPADAVSRIETAAILAGRPIRKDDPEYVLWCRRVDGSVRDGFITEYRIWGSIRRYSRAQLEPLKASFDAAGVNGRPSRKRARQARAKRAEAEGLVNTAGIAGVKRETAERWGRRGLYGARKIGGEHFFSRELIEARQRATPGEAEPVTCPHCREPVMRTRSRRRAKHSYHGHCWKKVRAQRLAEARAEMDPAELFRRRSEAQKRSWAEGKRDPSGYPCLGDSTSILDGHKDPDITEDRLAKMYETRFGREPTKERRRGWRRGANKRGGKVGGRPMKEAPADHHIEWAAKFLELRDYYEHRACAGVRADDDGPMPTNKQLCREVAVEDHAARPERWGYDPRIAPREASARVWKAIKPLLSADTETNLADAA